MCVWGGVLPQTAWPILTSNMSWAVARRALRVVKGDSDIKMASSSGEVPNRLSTTLLQMAGGEWGFTTKERNV